VLQHLVEQQPGVHLLGDAGEPLQLLEAGLQRLRQRPQLAPELPQLVVADDRDFARILPLPERAHGAEVLGDARIDLRHDQPSSAAFASTIGQF
jgi:hypothetical protein